MKRTYQPSRLIRKRRHGFRARMATKAGRQIINRRRAKGRAQLSAQFWHMAHPIFTIKKRSTFLMVREKGSFIRGKNINLQILINQDLNNSIGVGYIVTKKIGKAVKRNKARRIMKELAKKILIKSKINSYFVLIAKPSLLQTSFEDLFRELEDKINEI